MMDTRRLLLKEAEKLVRTRGFAAFSYADLSKRVGIRKASIHHHFSTKEELGGALIDGYLINFQEALQTILSEEVQFGKRLSRYADFFDKSIDEGMLPLCGALSAEMSALPKSMQERVRSFFELHLNWLQEVIRAGIVSEELRGGIDSNRAAELILSTLEGASLVAWATGDGKTVKRAVEGVIAGFDRGALSGDRPAV
jgi:TetR/AcrR family transcriptional regulator, transcriptional repressor for nem operon